MSESRINTELLARVRDHILEEPRRYNQESFGSPSPTSPCGTVACIGGWAAVLGTGLPLVEIYRQGKSVATVGQDVLGLTDDEATGLFSATPDWQGWPKRFARRYANAKTQRGRATAAAAYINWIIETGQVLESEAA